MAYSIFSLDGNGKYKVTARRMDGERLIQVKATTSDGTAAVLLNFEDVRGIMAFQAELVEAILALDKEAGKAGE